MEQLDNTTATSDGVVPGGESSTLKIQVKQEPMDQTQLVISEDEYETVMIKEEPPLRDSGRLEQRRRSVRVQSPSSEECDEGRVVMRPVDNVAQHVEFVAQPLPLFRDDNITQSEGSLHPNQVSSVRQSTEAPPERPQSCREGSKTLTCGECKKLFAHKSQLTEHVRIHTGEKPFQCEICNKSFGRAYSLKIHQRIHTGEKPYKCEEKGCNSAFSDSSNRNRHQQAHSNDMLLICDICMHTFRRKHSLTIHMVIHSGIKAHKCNICGKEFIRKSTLTRHHKIHLKKKPSQL